MKIKNILTVIIAIFFIAILVYVLRRCQETPVEKVVEKIEKIQDKNGTNHFRKEFENNASELSKNEIDSLKKVIEAKNSQIAMKNVEILSVTKLNASIRDTLKDFKLEKDALNNKIWKFEKIYKDGTKSKITMSEKDTTAIQSTDLKLYVSDFSAKENGKKKYYVDVTSRNENFTLNGSEVLRIPVKEPKDIFQINWANNYFHGIGNQMNFITSEVKFVIVPDNVIIPKAGAGFIWYLNDGKIFPYYNLGFDFVIKSVRK